jgi:hypothetical protein
MFTKAFGQMLGATASGNPAVIAGPIVWNARLVGQHAAALNTCFATIQLALAFGIAWRPLVRLALGASIAWSLAVWWLGEGLGGVLSGTASPASGAPGAVILYALLAVLLWPADRPAGPAPFTAARAVGAPAAKALWLVLWASLAYFAMQPASRAPQALHDMIAGMADGEPGWLAGIEKTSAGLIAHHGLPVSIGLAAALALIAAGVYLPPHAARAAPALATGHHAPHLLHGAAMLYTFLALTPLPAADGGQGIGAMGQAAAAMPVLRLPAVALVFALLLVGYTVRDLDLLSARYGPTPSAPAPGTSTTCRVAMGVTMSFMLIMMI